MSIGSGWVARPFIKLNYIAKEYGFYMDTCSENFQAHNPESPLLVGEVDSEGVVKERVVKSLKEYQLTLFD